MDPAVAFTHAVRVELGMRERKVRTHALMVWMLLAITAVAIVAYWDEQREFGAALTDFAGEQTALAQAVGTTLRARLVGVDASELPSGAGRSVNSLADVQMRLKLALQTEQFLLAVRAVERPQSVRLFVQGPFGLGLLTSDGHLGASARGRSRARERALVGRA